MMPTETTFHSLVSCTFSLKLMNWFSWTLAHVMGKTKDDVKYLHMTKQNENLCFSDKNLPSYKLVIYFNVRITCNNQKDSRFLNFVFITLEFDSVFCWVILLHRFDCQGVDVLLFVLIILKITCKFFQNHLLIVPVYSRPSLSFGRCAVWTRIFTWDVYRGTFQSADSVLRVIYSRAGFVTTTTWHMKMKTVSLLINMETL